MTGPSGMSGRRAITVRQTSDCSRKEIRMSKIRLFHSLMFPLTETLARLVIQPPDTIR